MAQNESEEIQDEIIQVPTIDNLPDIVNDLVESDPYTRRRIA
jgi:hypothetical protein